MPTWDVNAFFNQSISESLVNKKIKIDKVIQCLLKVTNPKEYKKYIHGFNEC